MGGGELCLQNVLISGGEVGVKVEKDGVLSMRDCKVRDAGVGLMLGSESKGEITSCVVEGNMVGISVTEGASVDISSSYVGKNKEQGLLVKCEESRDIFRADDALKEAEDMGIKVRDSEIAFNQLGDVILTEALSMDSFVLCPKHDMSIVPRRFSTPRSTSPSSNIALPFSGKTGKGGNTSGEW